MHVNMSSPFNALFVVISEKSYLQKYF